METLKEGWKELEVKLCQVSSTELSAPTFQCNFLKMAAVVFLSLSKIYWLNPALFNKEDHCFLESYLIYRY